MERESYLYRQRPVERSRSNREKDCESYLKRIPPPKEYHRDKIVRSVCLRPAERSRSNREKDCESYLKSIPPPKEYHRPKIVRSNGQRPAERSRSHIEKDCEDYLKSIPPPKEYHSPINIVGSTIKDDVPVLVPQYSPNIFQTIISQFVLKVASLCGNERLMVSLLSMKSEVTYMTAEDFKLAFTNKWFKYATILISLMTESSLKSFITEEIFDLAIPYCDSKLLMSLFIKSTETVQKLVYERLLHHFALKNKYDDFLNLLKILIMRLKRFHNEDLKLDFKNEVFGYATNLINLMTEDCLKDVITHETFHLAMSHCDPKLLISLFMKSTKRVQQLVIEDILYHFALNDEYDDFLNLLKTEIMRPKRLDNGETLFTSLLKTKNLKYCWPMINFATNKTLIVLANTIGETPLEISIETDLFDLMNQLIISYDEEFPQFNWNDPLIPLFRKLSINKNEDVNQKLLAAIYAIIDKGGDIYKETLEGTPIINYCTRFTDIIKMYHNKNNCQKSVEKKICTVCLDKEVNCAFGCGHIFCMGCADQVNRCPLCQSEVTTPMKLYLG